MNRLCASLVALVVVLVVALVVEKLSAVAPPQRGDEAELRADLARLSAEWRESVRKMDSEKLGGIRHERTSHPWYLRERSAHLDRVADAFVRHGKEVPVYLRD